VNDWTVTPLAAPLGARIDGVLLAETDDAKLGALQDLVDEHHVLAVSGQGEFSVADYVRVGESFGDPYVHPFIDAIPEHPAILQVIKEPDDTETFGGKFWCCDISFTSPPAALSILHACELSPIGSDTRFANTALAFDRLSLRLQAWVSELTATHVYQEQRRVRRQQRRTRSRRSTHAVVVGRCTSIRRSLPGSKSPHAKRAMPSFRFSTPIRPGPSSGSGSVGKPAR
jgi:taurine dioxygenase